MLHSTSQFVICVNNEGYPASLELYKTYRVLPDADAAEHNMIRVADESGEDYLYCASYLEPISLSSEAREDPGVNR